MLLDWASQRQLQSAWGEEHRGDRFSLPRQGRSSSHTSRHITACPECLHIKCVMAGFYSIQIQFKFKELHFSVRNFISSFPTVFMNFLPLFCPSGVLVSVWGRCGMDRFDKSPCRGRLAEDSSAQGPQLWHWVCRKKRLISFFLSLWHSYKRVCKL